MSYDTLTAALESRSDDDLRLQLVKRELLDENAKRRESRKNDAALKVPTTSTRTWRMSETARPCRRSVPKAIANRSSSIPGKPGTSCITYYCASWLERHFKLSLLDELHFFFGIHIEKVEDHYTMHQVSYIDNLLGRFEHMDAKFSVIPIDPAYLQIRRRHPYQRIPPVSRLWAIYCMYRST